MTSAEDRVLWKARRGLMDARRDPGGHAALLRRLGEASGMDGPR